MKGARIKEQNEQMEEDAGQHVVAARGQFGDWTELSEDAVVAGIVPQNTEMNI